MPQSIDLLVNQFVADSGLELSEQILVKVKENIPNSLRKMHPYLLDKPRRTNYKLEFLLPLRLYTAGPDGFAVDWVIGKSQQSYGTEIRSDTLVFLYEPFIFDNGHSTNVLDWSLRDIARRGIGLEREEDISINELVDWMRARLYPTNGLQTLKKGLKKDIPSFDASSKIYDIGKLLLTDEQIARNRLLYSKAVGTDALSKGHISRYKTHVSREIVGIIEFVESAGACYLAYSKLLAASKIPKK